MNITGPHGNEEEAPVNLMPLIDMVFLLLIFFLVASTFAKQERQIAIELPAASQSQALSAPPKQLVINITEDGAIHVGADSLTHAQLESLLRRTLGDSEDRVVFIRADERSRHGDFAEVVRICRDAGVKQLKIGYVASPQDQ